MADHFVIDGSNLATEGRTEPSLAQLQEAVSAFQAEHPGAVATVVVDASFEHRIDPAERNAFAKTESAGEVVSPPAGAVGRGDGFLLQIADRTGGTVISNDSFQEFHAEYEWLFEPGRLIGGKPVPGVGWIFSLRRPVRGIVSRKTVQKAKHADKAEKQVRDAIAEATASALEPDAPKRRRRRGGRGRGASKVETNAEPEAVNAPASFLQFVIDHRLGTEVEGSVDAFASHGAFVIVDGVRCYVPLSAMGDPTPNRARDVLARGETRSFVVQAVDAPRRGIELALPGFATLAGAPSEETVAAEVRTRRSQAKKDAAGQRGARKATKPATRVAKPATKRVTKPAPEKKTAKPAPAKQPAKQTAKPSAPRAATRKAAKPAPAKQTAKPTAKQAPAKQTAKAPTKQAARQAAARKAAKQAPATQAAKMPAKKTLAKKTVAKAKKQAPAKPPALIAPMIFEQLYLQCLSQASYLIGDETTGRAVVVDPQRDVSIYLHAAEARGLTIERVIETHLHADFLSGHLELADRTGARISYGAGARVDYPIDPLEDGARLSLGDVALEIIATPGHTPESVSVLVFEHDGDPVPYGVLTGDTLFIGDVGRPDLLTTAGSGLTGEVLGRQLYHSLHDKLLRLPDATRVFPAHGAGSACGKQLSTETSSTLGEQRRTNYALADMTEDEFVAVVTEGQPVAPAYFSFDAARNREARPLLEEDVPPPPMHLDAALAAQRDGAVLLDTREPAEFAAGHLRGAVNVGLHGRFAEYAGDVLRPEQPVVVVGEPSHALEAKVRLGRIGFDRVIGQLVLADPIAAFNARPELTEPSSRLTVAALRERLATSKDIVVVDVRGPGEVEASGSIPGAVQIPLPRIADAVATLDRARPTVVYCASGYRSSVAASVLRSGGFADVSDLLGGYDAWTGASEVTGTARASS